ncbi:hypothetical protein DIS24_g245 [Lasiodiplodia hormozganensis]|uniref:Zn(2)-C6 fungal-type domain-containing protein n=1 Tax=Lasiodiplodia hormozganensis TaxID=869390 RepID=A0AA39Z7A6_9PEZI|nr:hypothetical protein DIS24_g245 [Lasiodiplodia hormozganensis]
MSSVPPPEHRPAKRIRQACEPCRRKKSRCPGERPNCSHCSRLGQTCYYATDHPAASEYTAGTTDSNRDRHGSVSETAESAGPPGPWADRLSVLETKVAEVLGALNRIPWTASPPTPTPSTGLNSLPPPVDQPSPPATASTLPQWDTIVSVAELYLLYCNGQPLPLFDPKTFISTLGTKDPEVLFGILAVAVRFSDDPLYRDRREQAVRGYAEAARTLVMRRVSHGPIELSTLQALCLLSLVDFSDARVVQDGVKDQGITAYVIQLSQYWHKAVRYARRRANPGVHFPWSAESEYSKIMVSMMEFESHMPYKHRFRPSKFDERPTEELEKQRDYWCPWFFSQIIYHTIMCLLNHPLILSLRLRNFRVSIPEIFLQHTADLIASHTDWVIHLVDLVEEKSFRVTDPFIGNCVAVVATIYLQQSFADDAGIRTEKRNNFLKCLDFVRRLGAHWPHIAQIASKLQSFEATVSASYHDSSSSSSNTPSETSGQVFIDLTTFWEILEGVFTSSTSDLSGSLFGSSLWPHYRDPSGTVAGGTSHGEVVSSRLLPEPTYPRGESGGGGNARHNSVSTPGTSAAGSIGRNGGAGGGFGSGGSRAGATATIGGSGGGSASGVAGGGGGGDIMDSMALGMGDNDELAVLAQSYFAQGQDFVRGVDDWWSFGQV